MEKQCSALILPQAKPKTIAQHCSQVHNMGLFINDITIFQAGRGQNGGTIYELKRLVRKGLKSE